MQDVDETLDDNSAGLVQDGCNVEHHVPDISDEPGRREKARSRLMSEIRVTLQNLGWTESGIPGSLRLVVGTKPSPPRVNRNAAGWKTIVTQKRAEVL